MDIAELIVRMRSGELTDEDLSYMTNDSFHKEFVKYVTKKDLKKYRYLITFTLPEDHKHDEDEVEHYIVKQFQQRPVLQIEKAYMVKERTQKDIAHWHVAVCSTRCLKKDRFNYYIKKYGFVDISKSKAQHLEESLNYISKEVLPKKIV